MGLTAELLLVLAAKAGNMHCWSTASTAASWLTASAKSLWTCGIGIHVCCALLALGLSTQFAVAMQKTESLLLQCCGVELTAGCC